MKKEPLVSVIIPVYNGGKFIETAIKSVLSQSYKNFEIVIVDDGSVDNTSVVIDKYVDQAKIISFEQNKGGNVARNAGIKGSHGELITFLDSDDKWHKEKLKTYVDVMTRYQEVLFAFSDFNRFEWGTGEYFSLSNSQVFPRIYDVIENEFYSTRKAFVIPRSSMFPLLLSGYPTFSSTIMVRRRVFDIIGWWDESLKRNQDYDFSLRCANKTDFIYIDERLTDIGRHDSNVSKDITRQHDGDISLMKKHVIYDYYSDEQKELIKLYIGKRLAGAGYTSLHSGRIKDALRKYIEASRYSGMFWHASVRVIYTVFLLLVSPGEWLK